MKTIKGNLINLALDGEIDYAIHGLNCFCRMRSGLAPQMTRQWPELEAMDNSTVPGDPLKLGSIEALIIGGSSQFLCIVNAYTQYDYGTDGRKVEYTAINACFMALAKLVTDYAAEHGENPMSYKIGVPMIGAGLAGGDWDVIKSIIDHCLEGLNYVYVEWDGTIL